MCEHSVSQIFQLETILAFVVAPTRSDDDEASGGEWFVSLFDTGPSINIKEGVQLWDSQCHIVNAFTF